MHGITQSKGEFTDGERRKRPVQPSIAPDWPFRPTPLPEALF